MRVLSLLIVLGFAASLSMSLYLFLMGNNLGGLGAGALFLMFGFIVALAVEIGRTRGPDQIKREKQNAYNEGYEAASREMQMRVHKTQGLRQDR